MHARLIRLLVVGMFAAVMGCASSRVVESRVEPGFVGPIRFKKVLAMAVHPDVYVRRAAEDEMVQQIGPQRAVAANSVLNEEQRRDVKQLRPKLEAEGIDGVVTMRVAGARAQTSHIPGTSDSFFETYDRGGFSWSNSGYDVTDTIVSVQASIYSVADGKLIWSGRVETLNPTDVRRSVRDIIKAVGRELRKQNLLSEPAR
jgi:hypothetical protein